MQYSSVGKHFCYSNETRRTDYGSLRSTVKRKILTDPQKELQSIIMHLEEENRQLQIELLDIQGTKAERLQRHRATIESQLQRLKMLKVYQVLKILFKHCLLNLSNFYRNVYSPIRPKCHRSSLVCKAPRCCHPYRLD